MKIKFYNTYPKYEETEHYGYYHYAFSILPSLVIDNNDIWFHWMFWGINYTK